MNYNLQNFFLDREKDRGYSFLKLSAWLGLGYSVARLFPDAPLWQFLGAAYVMNSLTDVCVKYGGDISIRFQHAKFWKRICASLKGGITCEESLNPDEQYIFASFPHGAYTIQHLLTMTDGVGFLTDVYPAPRRDLVASVLFQIPLLREFVIALGNVDASSATAKYNIRQGRSLQIFVGGEREQLMTENGKHCIFLMQRKGFIKLALMNDIKIVPMYAFGEESAYKVLNWPLLRAVQNWLQRNLKMGIPVAFGRWCTLVPFTDKPLHIEIGKPIEYKASKKGLTIDEQIDEYHSQVVAEMRRLFDRTKAKHGEHDAELHIE